MEWHHNATYMMHGSWGQCTQLHAGRALYLVVTTNAPEQFKKDTKSQVYRNEGTKDCITRAITKLERLAIIDRVFKMESIYGNMASERKHDGTLSVNRSSHLSGGKAWTCHVQIVEGLWFFKSVNIYAADKGGSGEKIQNQEWVCSVFCRKLYFACGLNIFLTLKTDNNFLD